MTLPVVSLGMMMFNMCANVKGPEKPAKDGPGPLSVRLDASLTAPEYHTPLEWWQTHHMDIIDRGDLQESDCLYCHEPVTSCNNCHGYVGVRLIQPLQ